MKTIPRRDFLKSTAWLSASLSMGACRLQSQSPTSESSEILASHVVKDAQVIPVKYRWPRFVGKNGRIDFHGQHKVSRACRLETDQGAVGLGFGTGNSAKEVALLLNKNLSHLVSVERGILTPALHGWDTALHDLMGVVLDKPIYQLLGGKGPEASPVYSGMIYLDELNEGNPNKNIDIILNNCQWDYDYGYRQLKVKIGRSGRWYPHDEGLAKDIEVVNEIHRAFSSKGVTLLVDSNNMYNLEDTLAFLKGVSGVPLLWVEEPFHENVEDGRKLRQWMDANGFAHTLYADGEAKPDHDVLMELSRSGRLDAYLSDIVGYGFTPWRKLMPKLKQLQVQASPHAWGSRQKTNITSHLAAGLGNVVTIEGVTCLSDEIDFGNYPIRDGLLHVSNAPGFGMKLLL